MKEFDGIEPGQKKTFDLYESALACVTFIIFNVLFLLLFRLIPLEIRSLDAVYYIASFLIEFLFAVAAYTVARARKINIIQETGMNKKVSAKLVGYAFLISIVCLIFFSDITSCFMEFLYLCGYKSVLSGIEIDTFWKYLIYVVITCATPAFCEELLFRGVIASGFKKYGKTLAVVLSALIFMLMHGNAEQTVHQFIIGLVIGYIFISTGNLWIGVIIHFFNNFIAVTELYIFTELAKSLSESGDLVGDVVNDAVTGTVVNPWLSLFINLIIALIFASLGFFLVRFLIKKANQENDRINVKKEEPDANATILVDGTETDVSMTVDGETVETYEFESGETETITPKQTKENKPQLSIATIAMFTLSGAYLLFDWITALLAGLGLY